MTWFRFAQWAQMQSVSVLENPGHSHLVRIDSKSVSAPRYFRSRLRSQD